MKRYGILILVMLLGISFSCSDKEMEHGMAGWVGENEVVAVVDFGHKPPDQVVTVTKATLGIVPESRVQNLFVFLFVNGRKVYSHPFDFDNKETDLGAVGGSAKGNCWAVENMKQGGVDTRGSVKMTLPQFDNGNLYMIANVDADMVNISAESLNLINSEEELKGLSIGLNQLITSRNGYFPMVAREEGVSLSGNRIVRGGTDVVPQLERWDAKVKVRVRVATDNELTTVKPGETKKQKLKAFIPTSWQVMRLPRNTRFQTGTPFVADEYFDSEPVEFEGSASEEFSYKNSSGQSVTVTSPVYSFSFYMLENKPAMKQTTGGNYYRREARKKDPDGRYADPSQGMWVYAPEEGTYLVVRGEVEMEVDVSSEAKKQPLAAEVAYYIHLGDISQSMDNYEILRNTVYNYTLTIKGLNNIEVEVESSSPTSPEFKEPEPGSTGDVYIAKESLYTFDAHYGQRVFAFDAAYIDPETVTWYVKTPFGREGTPYKSGDTEVPTGLDYKWVHFKVNPVENNVYSHNNQAYPGDGNPQLMDVLQFTAYVKDQKRKFAAGQPNDFRVEEDPVWKTKFPDNPEKYNRWRIYATAFVDEFYYEVHPISQQVRQDLWKEFVNQPNRIMHILCDNQVSLDEASSSTGSVVTIRQRSIQTPYNIDNPGLNTAWGVETVNESGDGMWFYTQNDRNMANFGSYNPSVLPDSENGLANTAKLWNLMDGEQYWNTYLDFNVPNDAPGLFMRPEYAVLRYAALMRNRDNNGNGKIDPEEVKWYISSYGQLTELFMGELGVSGNSRLYPIEKTGMQGTFSSGPFSGADRWREHIVTSSFEEDRPRIIWAEEGVSVSGYMRDYGWGNLAPYSIRCARNLGMAKNTSLTSMEATPDPMVRCTEVASGQFVFDLTRINRKSLRFFTSRELEPGDQNSEMARLYSGFETGELIATGDNYDVVKANLENGKQYGADGWRLPNIREAALMSRYCNSWAWNEYILVSSYYALGNYGSQRENKTTWYVRKNFITLGGGDAKIRLVRDFRP